MSGQGAWEKVGLHRARCVFAGPLWVASASLLLAGCTAACPLAGQHHVSDTRLFFGRDIPGGGQVTDPDWSDFAATVLTPAFPDGFTTYAATGQWRSPVDAGISREKTLVVEIVGTILPTNLETAIGAYRTRFRQDSVGVVTGEVCAAF